MGITTQSMFEAYRAYINDNPQGYWFRKKLWGWGWTPATWQGWAVLVGFVAVVFLNFYRIDTASHSASDTLTAFVPETLLLTILLIIICWKKGEKPSWQWGIPEKYRKS